MIDDPAIVFSFAIELVAANVDAVELLNHVANGPLFLIAAEKLRGQSQHACVERHVDHFRCAFLETGKIDVDLLRCGRQRRKSSSVQE